MVIDYKDTIKKCMQQVGGKFECTGMVVGGFFLPKDMIEQLYNKVFNSPSSVESNHCKEIPNNKEYEFYQWNGDPEDIKRVLFLKDISEDFTIGCKDYGNYHLDYSGNSGIVDVYPGDYLINRENGIEIYRKEEFEKKFIFR